MKQEFKRLGESASWSNEIAWAYGQGLEDAKNQRPNIKAQYFFRGAYDQGYHHGEEVSYEV